LHVNWSKLAAAGKREQDPELPGQGLLATTTATTIYNPRPLSYCPILQPTQSTMSDSVAPSSPQAPGSLRSNRPMSEALLNEKACDHLSRPIARRRLTLLF